MASRSALPLDPPPRRQWLTLAAVVFGVFVTTLDNTIVNVALPAIQDDLGLGLGGLAWVVNAYILAFAVLLLTGGRLADSFGRRRLYLLGLGVFTVASLLAGLASSPGLLIAARVFQGVGAALLTPPTLAIISDTFRDETRRATAIGIWGGVTALAFAIGPLLGGLITEHLQWQWVFYVNVPVGIAGVLAGLRVIPESRDPDSDGRLDLGGLAVSAAALFSLTYALIRGDELGWGSPVIVALLAIAGIGLAAFVRIERRAASPLVDLALFRARAFTGANVVGLMINLGSFGVFLFTSLFFQDVLHHSPVEAGAALLPWVAMLIVLAPLSGRLAGRIPPRLLVAVGLVVMGGGLLLLSGADEHSRYGDLLPGLLVGGFGAALTVPLSAVAIGSVPVARSGVASGIFNTARETGGSLGIAVVGAVLAAGQHGALAHGSSATQAFAAGYADGLTVAALLTFAAAVIAAVTLGPERAREGNAPDPVAVAA